jgi:hypothetical protein
MVEVYTLLVVLISDGGVTSYSRTFRTEYACQIAQAMTREAVPRALGVLDAGTICVKSVLNPDLKPRA